MKIKRNTTIQRNTKKESIIMKRNPPGYVALPEKNIGGFLPDPPEDCEKKEFWVSYYKNFWIDLSICHSCSIKKECITRSDYLSFLQKNRQNKLLEKTKKETKKEIKKEAKND